MNLIDNWRVNRLAVVSSGRSSRAITSWGVYVDGAVSAAVQPHIQVCMDVMKIQGTIRPGTASPFFTVVNHPSRGTEQAMETFETLLRKREIVGPYCDDAGEAMLLEWSSTVRVTKVTPQAPYFLVDIASDGLFHLGQLENHRFEEFSYTRTADRTTAQLQILAPDAKTLAAELRLAGSIGGLRWDPDDRPTVELIGLPLV